MNQAHFAAMTGIEAIQAAGYFAPALMVLSVAAFALVVYCLIEGRRGALVAPAIHERVVDRLASRDKAGALAELAESTSLYAGAATVALSQPVNVTPGEVRLRARALCDRLAALMRVKILAIQYLAVLAALVGLLGAAWGMLEIFSVMAREEFRATLLYSSMFKAVLVSVMGLGLATASFAVGFVLSWRLERTLVETAFAVEQVIAGMQHGDGAGVATGAMISAGHSTRLMECDQAQ